MLRNEGDAKGEFVSVSYIQIQRESGKNEIKTRKKKKKLAHGKKSKVKIVIRSNPSNDHYVPVI